MNNSFGPGRINRENNRETKLSAEKYSIHVGLTEVGLQLRVGSLFIFFWNTVYRAAFKSEEGNYGELCLATWAKGITIR